MSSNYNVLKHTSLFFFFLITAVEARDLKGGKRLAPFCKVFLDKEKKFQSEVMSKTHDPSWNDEKARLMLVKKKKKKELFFFFFLYELFMFYSLVF